MSPHIRRRRLVPNRRLGLVGPVADGHTRVDVRPANENLSRDHRHEHHIAEAQPLEQIRQTTIGSYGCRRLRELRTANRAGTIRPRGTLFNMPMTSSKRPSPTQPERISSARGHRRAHRLFRPPSRSGRIGLRHPTSSNRVVRSQSLFARPAA